MKTRMIVAFSLLPILLAIVLFCPVWVTAVLVCAMSVLAAYELLYATGLLRHRRILIYSAAAAVSVCLWSCFGLNAVWGYATVWLYFIALFAELLAAKTELQFSKLISAPFAGLFIPYALSALTRILTLERGRFYILIALLLAFISDSGAYFIGRRFGKLKLVPQISPNKTVEGFAGGIVSEVLAMVLYCLVLQIFFGYTMDYLSAVLYGIIGSLGAVAGDLVFSVIKRQTGLKDYGNLLPGHGGILDRFDSMIVVAPLTELLVMTIPVIVK